VARLGARMRARMQQAHPRAAACRPSSTPNLSAENSTGAPEQRGSRSGTVPMRALRRVSASISAACSRTQRSLALVLDEADSRESCGHDRRHDRRVWLRAACRTGPRPIAKARARCWRLRRLPAQAAERPSGAREFRAQSTDSSVVVSINPATAGTRTVPAAARPKSMPPSHAR